MVRSALIPALIFGVALTGCAGTKKPQSFRIVNCQVVQVADNKLSCTCEKPRVYALDAKTGEMLLDCDARAK